MDLHTYIQSSKPEPRKATSSLIMIMIMIVMIIMILIMIMIIMIMLYFLPEHSRLLSPHRPTLLPSSKELKQMMMMMTVMMIMKMTMMTMMMGRCEQMVRATAMGRGEVTSAQSGEP